MNIIENLHAIQAEIPDNVQLVAVSKTKPEAEIMAVYETGFRDFGENKPQELREKEANLPDDIRWHYIGHLQRNKVKYLAPFVQLIHAVDSMRLLKTIDKEAKKNDRTINCLLQMHIAEEDSKFGMTSDNIKQLLDTKEFAALKNVNITGLMGMATFTDDTAKIRSEFQRLRRSFDEIKQSYFREKQDFRELSMGMTNDYRIAIEEGSTILRIGSLIFGERNYH